MGDVVVTREDREAAERLIDNTNDFPAWLADDLRDAIATMRAKLRAERDAVLAKLERVRAWASRQNAWTENELLAILDGKEGV